MRAAAANAEIFWTAFRSLPKAERQAVIDKLLADRRFREIWSVLRFSNSVDGNLPVP